MLSAETVNQPRNLQTHLSSTSREPPRTVQKLTMSGSIRESPSPRRALQNTNIFATAPSLRLLERYRSAYGSQRRSFEEERGVWELERQRLHGYISSLETSLKNNQAATLHSDVQPEEPKHVRTGDEVWQGTSEVGKIAAPSRQLFVDENLFPDPSNLPPSEEEQQRRYADKVWSEQSKAPQKGNAGPSIPRSVDAQHSPDPSKPPSSEDWPLRSFAGKASPERSKAPFVLGTGISVPEKGGDLEGIHFRENIRAPPIAESFMASQSSSSAPYPSTPGGVPKPVTNPRLGSPIQLLTKEQLLSQDRTRRIRKSLKKFELEAANKTAAMIKAGRLPGPMQVDPPQSLQESCSSAVKVPSESVGGFYPAEALNELYTSAGDVELKEPLALNNINLEDRIFLSEVDSKLTNAALSNRLEPREDVRPEEDNSPAQMDLDSELEVELKQSMNFGSPFGAPYHGK